MVRQMIVLQEGSKRIADGDLSAQIDTTGLSWEFKKHAENINRIGDGISAAVEQRMKSEHFRTELITNVSHDIKTPLTSIINYVDLMKKEGVENPTLAEYVDVLDRQSARLKKLIEDLMEASKASTGNLTVHLERCDARVLLTQIVGEFEEKTAARELTMVVNNPQEPLWIMVDSRHIWRVLENLLNNICKYAQPQTRVYITLEKIDADAVLTFRNISHYQLNISSEELMERFVRGDSSRNTEGSGLGLSIAQSLTALMNGTLELFVDGDLFKVVLKFGICGESE
jgi:signal transduction histidine kinase